MGNNNYYTKQIQLDSEKIEKTKKKQKTNSWFRGITFILGITLSIIVFNKFNIYIGFFCIIFFISLLLFLVKKSNTLNQKIKYQNIHKKINEDELKALDYNFSSFHNGNEYINSSHDFSFDLDVFGENSIFQMLNRAFTERGRNFLSKTLNNPLTASSTIKTKQNTVEELSQKTNLIQHFLTKAKISSEEEKKSKNINSTKSDVFKNKFSNYFWKIILIIQPIISISLIALIILKIIPDKVLYLYTILMFLIIGIYIKYINNIHTTLSKQAKIHKQYSELLEIIEKNEFESDELKKLQQKINIKGQKVSEILKKYSQLLTALDNRLNFIFALLSDTLVLWDIQTVRRIEIHNKKYMNNFDSWLEVIAEFEFYCSLAVFKFNNPNYNFPSFNSNFEFKAEKLGHPLIPKNKMVSNDFSFTNQSRTFIITGANMAGKSTFLRTIGVNFILAQIGSVVCAEKMNFHPMNIITSIRITDSLYSDESYFYAELKRLKYIIEKIEESPNTLIIIDEMLRGTNSDDKHKGSEGILKKLTQKQITSFLATHDVELGDLENLFPERIKNYCFEAQIKDNELFFDYKIQSGVSQNLNASFLMKKMNIID